MPGMNTTFYTPWPQHMQPIIKAENYNMIKETHVTVPTSSSVLTTVNCLNRGLTKENSFVLLFVAIEVFD